MLAADSQDKRVAPGGWWDRSVSCKANVGGALPGNISDSSTRSSGRLTGRWSFGVERLPTHGEENSGRASAPPLRVDGPNAAFVLGARQQGSNGATATHRRAIARNSL